MSEQFNISEYLRTKVSPEAADKIARIELAKEQKLNSLRAFNDGMRANSAAILAREQANRESVVGQLGLDPEGLAGRTVNLGVSAYAGVSRGIGDVASLPTAISAAADEAKITESEFQAFNRYKTGKATPEDMALLNTKKSNDRNEYSTPEAQAYAWSQTQADPNALTALQLIERAQGSRETSRNIVEAFDRQGTVHQGARTELRADIATEFQSAWDQTGLGNLFEKGKEVGSAKDIAIGLSKLVYNAGEAAVSNPQGAGEYMAENIPQLLVGGIAKWGKYGLAAMNAGYAVDQYSQGIENFKAKNNGQMPDEATRQHMAVNATVSFLAEHLGEVGQLKAIGKASRVVEPGQGVVNSAKNITKAAVLGGGGESLTEGIQTYSEGEATLKPASAEDIYVGGTIGGISGGGISTGGRALAEASGATPEKVAFERQNASDFKEAAKTGDVSAYLDPKSRDYNPSRAVAALYQNSKQEGITPEAKAENLAKADEIVSKLQAEQIKLQELSEATSPKALEDSKKRLATLEAELAATTSAVKKQELVTAIEETNTVINESVDDAKVYARTQEKLTALNRHLEAVAGHRAQLDRVVNGTAEADVTGAVEAADTTVDSTDTAAVETATKGIDQVIKLSMSAPDSISPEMLTRLIENKDNSLTDDQRNYLRVFSDAKAAENALKNMGKVTGEVRFGTADGKNIGLTQYRDRISAAVKTGDLETSSKLLDLLGNFAENHQNKAKAIKEATEAYAKDNSYRRVERNTDGTWSVQLGFFKSAQERTKNGGLNIGNGGVVLQDRITAEADAITKMHMAMTQAVGLNQSVSVQKQVAPSTTPAALATASPTPAAPVVSVAPAPKVKAPKATPQEKELKRAERAQRKVIRNNPVSLWSKLKNSLNDVDLNEIYGSEWKKRYTSLKKKDGGRSIVDMVADGLLDEYLPYQMRSSVNDEVTNPSWETEGEQYIKEMMRGGNYLTYDTQMEAQAIGFKIQDLEREIANGTLTIEDIKNELEYLEASETEQTQEGETEADTSVIEATQVEQESTTGDTESVVTEDGKPATDIVAKADGALEVLAESQEGKLFSDANLLAEQTTQEVSRDGDASKRPLVAVKNFLSTLLGKGTKIGDFLPVGMELNDKQKNAVRLLMTQAKAWFPQIKKNLVKGYWNQTEGKAKENSKFAYADLMQFLIQGTNENGLDLEENVKTAIVYAAMRAVEEYSTMQYNSSQDINTILGRKKDVVPTQDERMILGEVGTRENFWRNAVGKVAVQALGFKPNSNAQEDLMPRLESAFGAHIEKLLLDSKMLVREQLTKDQMTILGYAESAPWNFVRMDRDESGTLHPDAIKITNGMKGTGSVLDKLFSVQSGVNQPTLEPQDFDQRNAAGVREGIPANIKAALDEKQKEKNMIRDDMWALVASLDQNIFLQMADWVDMDNTTIHANDMLSVNAKNEGLVREYNNMKEFVEGTLLSAGTALAEVPFYFQYSVKKQQRVHIDNNGFNPQASKMHRFMFFKPSWKTEIAFTDKPMLDLFKLRVAEGLGVKTDAQLNSTTLQNFNKLFDAELNTSPEGKAAATTRSKAIEILQKMISGNAPTAEEQKSLLAAVKLGGEKIHSLSVLLEMAEYQSKLAGKATGFTSYMQGEIDGKTNGIILGQLLFGGADSVTDMKERLRRGGFYFDGDVDTQFNAWRAQGGNLDQYETLAKRIVEYGKDFYNRNVKHRATFAAVEFFTKPLEIDGQIQKAGRDLTKNPLTTMMFGSALYSAVDKMAEKMIEEIYKEITKAATPGAKTSLSDVLTNLNTLIVAGGGSPINTKMTAEQALSAVLDDEGIKQVKKAFHATLGKAAKQAISTDFSKYLANRDLVNKVAKLTYELSNAASKSVRTAYIQELVAKGELAVNSKGEPVQGLKRTQQKELDKRIATLIPRIHTVGSKREDKITHGVRLGKTKSKLSENPVYQSSVKFGSAFVNEAGKQTFALETNSNEFVEVDPGPGTSSKMVHSLDSSVSHDTQVGREVLNNHDALAGGLAGFVDMGRGLNQNLWNNLVQYSPMNELLTSFTGTVQAIVAMGVDSSNQVLSEVAQNNLSKVLNEFLVNEDGAKNPEEALNNLIQTLATEAYQAERMKLETLSEVVSVDQYTLEGGNYMPTPEERTEVTEALAQLSPDVPLEVTTAVDSLTSMLAGKLTNRKPVSIKPTKTNVFGNLGAMQRTADVDWQGTFEKRKTLTTKQVVHLLRKKLPVNSVNREILEKIAPLLNENLTISLVDATTQEADVLALPDTLSSAWYVRKDGQEAIYVLSGNFQESNMSSEMLLHELLHAATAQTLRNPSKAGQALIAELTELLGHAKAVVDSDTSLAGFAPAVSSLDELISWGMTNKAFQVKVLSKVRMESKTKGNVLITGLKQFIQTITNLLFRNPTKQQTNGVAVLMANVSGLLTEGAKASEQQQDVNLSMSATVRMSTLDIHNALGNGAIDPAFDEHLKSLLAGIVESIHGPMGTLKDLVEQNVARTPMEVFHEAQATNAIPFASDAVKGGFKITAQESFAIDQVEATVRAALTGNEGELTAAYTEMYRLYTEARLKLKDQDYSADPQKQALVDFVFKIDSGKGNRSDYLSRFAALGLAHQEFRGMLDFATDRDSRTVGDIKGIPAKLSFLFTKFLNFFNSKVTHTYSGQSADAKLATLVGQLVEIETRRRQMLDKPKATLLGDYIEDSARGVMEGVRRKVGDFGESAFFQNSSNEFVKLAGNTLSIIGHDRADAVLDTIAKYRDYLVRDKQGMVAGMISEVRGLPQTFQTMLRATKLNEKARKNLSAWTAKTVIDSFAEENMSDKDKEAVTQVFLRTDMAALLENYTMEDLIAAMENTSTLEQNIKDLEQELATQFSTYANYMRKASKFLAYRMVTDRATNENVMLNAGNIASMYGTAQAGKLTEAQQKAATKIIDKLTSFYALQYSNQTQVTKALRVFKQEMARTDGGNGISMLLNTHLNLQKESRARLFSESEALMMKGYLPDVTDPNIDVRVATAALGKELIDQGYKQVGEAMLDPKDYNQEQRYMYIMTDSGLNAHSTGIVSLSSLQSRGSEVFMAGPSHKAKVEQHLASVTNKMFTNAPDVDPRTVKSTYAVPVLNALGKTVEYRYMMYGETKDVQLRRDNRFEKLLGTMAGQTLDKVESKIQNAKAIQSLKDFYEADLAEHPDSYLRVGPTSTDPELREVWNLLPQSTREEALKVWGADGMMVRNDLMDINFGYRKLSVADLFEKNNPNAIEHQFVKFVELAMYMYARHMGNMSMVDSEKYKKRSAKVVRRIERMWQEVVHEMKDIIVMKTGVVMIGNIVSNISLLMMNGVSFVDIVKTHRTAMVGALEYQNDQQEIYTLKQKLDTKQTQGQDAEIENTIKRLEDRIARNPVRELMEAGLMPSIVEDVAAEEDIYSYKSELVRRTEKYVSKLNPTVVNAGRTLYMAHDTDLYKWMNHITQLSDFVARYTLYQHLVTKKNGLSKTEAIQEASDSFINYDIPAHRKLQYLDDMGIFMFTKYFMRIQKVLLKLAREHPTRVFGMMAMDHFINLGPIVTESSFLAHFGNNPLRMGAFQYPTVLDNIATVHAGLQIFK